jgi:hypothetical protein
MLHGKELNIKNINIFTSVSERKQTNQYQINIYLRTYFTVNYSNEYQINFYLKTYFTVNYSNEYQINIYLKTYFTVNYSNEYQINIYLKTYCINRENRVCNLCQGMELGDEFHYLFECTEFIQDRARLIHQKYRCSWNTVKYCALMCSNSVVELSKLCKFNRLDNSKVCP